MCSYGSSAVALEVYDDSSPCHDGGSAHGDAGTPDAPDRGGVGGRAHVHFRGRGTSMVRRKLKSLDETIADDPLGAFFVWWLADDTPAKRALSATLRRTGTERQMQRFLESYPILLARLLGGGHGRWVIPHSRLGSQHVTDFLIGTTSSLGYEWMAVELESPGERMFTSRGDPTATLNHAIRQVIDWRNWLSRNRDYATRPRDQDGLGLTDIDPNLPGLILIGRRSANPSGSNERRRRLASDLRIQFHSYDWLKAGSEKLFDSSSTSIIRTRSESFD